LTAEEDQDVKRVLVIGASGFGAEVAWVIGRMNAVSPTFEIVGFCDDAPGKQEGQFCGLPLLGRVESAAEKADGFVCAVGSNGARKVLTERALEAGLVPVTVVDPSAVIAPGTVLGRGCYVGIGSVVSVGVRLGEGALVNHGVTVGHDAEIGDYAQLCPGVRVSGGCVLGEGVLMGSNACVIPCVRVGAWATVGAGAAVLRDVDEKGLFVRLCR